MDKDEFLDSIKRAPPLVLTDNSDPKLCLELPLEEQVRLSQMSFQDSNDIFLKAKKQFKPSGPEGLKAELKDF